MFNASIFLCASAAGRRVWLAGLIAGGFLLVAATATAAPAPAETRAAAVASKAFQDKIYPLAEKGFAEFLARYPDSELRPEILLNLGISRYFQTNYPGAIEHFRAHLKQENRLGALADQFYFWLAESLFQTGDYAAAAEAYAQLTRKFPQSQRRWEAGYGEALCYSRGGQWARVVEILRRPDGYLAAAAKDQPNNEFVLRGRLLLAEALFTQKEYPPAETTLQSLDAAALPADLAWRRELLLARVRFESGNLELAFQTATNAAAMAARLGQVAWQGESNSLEAEILEKLNRWADALQAYERNLAEAVPIQSRRRALSKIVELTLLQNRTGEAVRRLEAFIEQNPRDPALDVARVTLGELFLRQYFESITQASAVPAPVLTNNVVAEALTNFDRVIADFPSTPLLGKVHLNRGWAYWAQGNNGGARDAFKSAQEKLPFSEAQAVSLFKLGDCQYRLEDYDGAISSYNLLIQNYSSLTRVKEELFPQALYQILRASLRRGNQAVARDAMARILAAYPNTFYSDHGVLLLGQNLTRVGSPAEARGLFVQFLDRFTNSVLLPEVKLAVAGTYAREQQWPVAIEHYDRWIGEFPSHPLLPEAEFFRALANYQDGRETNALTLFTNFVARFPTNDLAPRAQIWLGDYYFDREDFANAERNYQLVYQTLKAPLELSFQARLMAGRAAFELQQLNDARRYFSELVKETNAPPALAAEAWFALGDTIFQQFLADTNKPPDKFNEAITAFSRIVKEYPAMRQAILAWGRMGDCHAVWADLMSDRNALELAAQAYRNVVTAPEADGAARNQAEVGLGRVLEKKGNPQQALEHYLKALYDENSDPFWIKEAGLAAARLCESLDQWEQAANIYRRLVTTLPALQPALEKKMAFARQRAGQAKN